MQYPTIRKIWGYLKNLFQLPHVHLPNNIDEGNLPLKLASKISIKDYNKFLDQTESSGYKFFLDDNGCLFVIDMSLGEHEETADLLRSIFSAINNNIYDRKIIVSGQPFHYSPSGNGQRIAADVTIFPGKRYVLASAPQYPGIPPCDYNGKPHARVICEIGVCQSYGYLKAKCQLWMQEKYVRCVLGIKIHSKRDTKNINGQYHRSLTAILLRQNQPRQKYDFGTLGKNTDNPTGCNAPNLPNFQIRIPISDIFWDPPIVDGIPNLDGYNVVVPPTINSTHVIIDLFRVQQAILESQRNN